jgi:DNA-nicking Smr family endonuclease
MARKDKHPEALKKARKSQDSGLSEEERELWDWAARDLKPLKVKRPRVTAAPSASSIPAKPPPERVDVKAIAKAERARPAPALTKAGRAPAPAVPPLADVDRRKVRKVGSGRVEIEARIDLHGMTQSEAHPALRRFLLRAHAQGRRWVLVITGKGAAFDRSLNRTMDPLDGSDIGGNAPRGILRRNVPFWLAEPELRAIVVGFTSAAIRHGGEGALYVQLRKRRED